MDGARTINPSIDENRAAPSFCRPSRGVARCGIWGKTMRENKETEMLLRLMRAALHQDFETPIPWETGCDAEKLNVLIRRQSLVTMVYPVIARQSGDGWESLREGMKDFFARETHRNITQEYEIEWLLDEMEASGIDCLPMKGWVIRNDYPDPLMRSMTDFDVLIRDLNSRRMKDWMEARGYKPDHIEQPVQDCYWKKPYMYVELHRRMTNKGHMLPDEIKLVSQKEQTLWKSAKRLKGKQHIYQISDEDVYIHYMIHFYKHFTTSGAGIRFLADNYVFLKEKGAALDRNSLKKQLDGLHLSGFAKQMEQAAKACFGTGQPLDEREALIVDYLTSTGIHGNQETMEMMSGFVRGGDSFKQNKVLAIWRQCFPSIWYMREQYPKLDSHPQLLPFYWGKRLCRVLIKERFKIAGSGLLSKGPDEETSKEIERLYRAAGIFES